MIDASGQFQRPPRSGGDLRTVLRPYQVVDLDAVTLLCAWHAAFSLRTRGMGSTGPRRLEILEPLVDLRAVHPDRGGGSDSEADPVALDRHHGNPAVARNHDLLPNLSRQHQPGLYLRARGVWAPQADRAPRRDSAPAREQRGRAP